jgi:hypothetical protein
MVDQINRERQLVVRVLFRDCHSWKQLWVASVIALRRAFLVPRLNQEDT